MPQRRPAPISQSERRARQSRASRVARQLGFVGRVEYRHVYSLAGGGQYGLAAVPDHDLLMVTPTRTTFPLKRSSPTSVDTSSWPATRG
jgi:hypothetical protein